MVWKAPPFTSPCLGWGPFALGGSLSQMLALYQKYQELDRRTCLSYVIL